MDLLESVFHLPMHGCSHPDGIVFVLSDTLNCCLLVEWEANNLLARWLITCFLTFYCNPNFLLKILKFCLFMSYAYCMAGYF